MNKKQNRKNYSKKADAKFKNGSDRKVKDGNASDVAYSDRRVCHNDPSWYAANDQLMRDAASLAFSNNLGSKIGTLTDGITDFYNVADASVPGIFTLRLAPTCGWSDSTASAVNVAARNLYSYVRHANSGHTNYDSPDLMLYVLGMSDAYAMWAFMVRAYGIMNTYSTFNRYYPKAIVHAMHLDFDDFQRNIADFRAFINTYAFKLGSICIPNSMSLYARRIWLYSHIWVDSPGKKPQTYMFNPAGFLRYDETSMETGGALMYKQFLPEQGEMFTFSELRKFANSLIEPILSSEDMMIMSGDILKAFGADRLYKVASISEDFIIYPEYSEEVCSQIQNADVLTTDISDEMFSPGSADAGYKIWSDVNTNAIICMPTATMGLLPVTSPEQGPRDAMRISRLKYKLLNIRKDSPTPEDVMVSTRLKFFTESTFEEYENGMDVTIKLREVGTEVAAYADITRIAYDEDGTQRIYREQNSTYINFPADGVWNEIAWPLHLITNMEKFDWHPICYLFHDAKIDNPISCGLLLTYTGDLDNFTKISEYELSKMNNVALLSEFGAPTMGAFA